MWSLIPMDPLKRDKDCLALQALFPELLPDGLALDFDPSKYGEPNTELKSQLAKLLLEHPERKSEVIGLWKALFDSEEWLALLNSLE